MPDYLAWVTKLSELTIDADKDWNGKNITNPGNIDGVDVSAHAADPSAHHTKTTSSEIDHGSVVGLGDDDHPQYLTTGRHDTTTRHPLGTVVPHDDHGALSGLGDDDHPQYLTTGRHDTTTRHPLGTVVPHDDHGALSGLGDDDHPQYLTTGRHDITDRHPLGTVVPHDDHGALSGLGDDDHPQYLLVSGARAMAGHLDMNNHAITKLMELSSNWGNHLSLASYTADGAYQTDVVLAHDAKEMRPASDANTKLGNANYRWSDIYAVNTHWGDLGFAETTCPKCNKRFKIGDNIILKVIRFDEEDGGIMTVPIHLECADLPSKTIKKKIPVKEDYYMWDEEKGKAVKRRRNKTIKKTVTKKKIKPGYKLDEKSKKFWKLKKQGEKMVRERVASETEAIEEVEEEIEEVVYEEKEFTI